MPYHRKLLAKWIPDNQQTKPKMALKWSGKEPRFRFDISLRYDWPADDKIFSYSLYYCFKANQVAPSDRRQWNITCWLKNNSLWAQTTDVSLNMSYVYMLFKPYLKHSYTLFSFLCTYLCLSIFLSVSLSETKKERKMRCI